MPAHGGITTTGSEPRGGAKQSARNTRSVVILTFAVVMVSGLCLKARPMPYVWFLSFWACALFGFIFCVRRSWPRTLLFSASVASATLAVAEAYYWLHEFEASSMRFCSSTRGTPQRT